MTPKYRNFLIAAVGFFVLAGAEFLRANANADLPMDPTAGDESETGGYYDEPLERVSVHGAKIALGSNANAALSLDLVANGGAGNQRDDGVTTGAASGRGTTIAIEVFATNVKTSLIGIDLKFAFDLTLVSIVKAENSTIATTSLVGTSGVSFISLSPMTLTPTGFLARAEFETDADVTGREFSIGIEKVTIVERNTSPDELTTASVIRFNTTPSADFDGDGTVGFSDFLAFAGGFGSRVPPSGCGGGGGGTPSGFASADQNAFDRLAVGKRIPGETFFADVPSAGPLTEGFRRVEGRYTYTNTGPNTGNLTQTYDDSQLFGGRCTIELTFTSSSTGTI